MIDLAIRHSMDLIKLQVDQVGHTPRYAVRHDVFTAAAFVSYNLETGKAFVLMVDGNVGASITNAADTILPFIHRQHLGRRGFRWKDVRWIYRDTTGCWDEIKILAWEGGNTATVGFQSLSDRSEAAALAAAEELGFAFDAHDRAHLRNAIHHVHER